MIPKTLVVGMVLLSVAGLAGAQVLIPQVPANLEGAAPVAVTLEVDATTFPSATLAEFKTCEVTVFEGATLATALDQATLDGCITGWTWTYYASTLAYGRFVTGVDGRQANCDTWPTLLVTGEFVLCTYYTIQENGESAPAGVDGLVVSEGHTYTFTHNVAAAVPLP